MGQCLDRRVRHISFLLVELVDRRRRPLPLLRRRRRAPVAVAVGAQSGAFPGLLCLEPLGVLHKHINIITNE